MVSCLATKSLTKHTQLLTYLLTCLLTYTHTHTNTTHIQVPHMIRKIVSLMESCKPASIVEKIMKGEETEQDIVDLNVAIHLVGPLISLTVVNGIPVTENQIRVVREITQNSTSVIVSRKELLQYFGTAKENKATNLSMKYFANITRLLGSCCQGKMNLAEATCQEILSHELCLSTIVSKEAKWSTKLTLIYFLYHVYLESSTPVREMIYSKYMEKLINHFVVLVSFFFLLLFVFPLSLSLSLYLSISVFFSYTHTHTHTSVY